MVTRSALTKLLMIDQVAARALSLEPN